MGKKKKLMNKKNSQKFTLVHRSQRDPLQADEESAQRVLVPIKQNDSGAEEKMKYGIFFEDNYDYMQHLRTRQRGEIICDSTLEEVSYKQKDDKVAFGKLLLPKEVLPSKYEEKEGMLSKGILPRGPQPDWDPDIVAALDDEVNLDDPENILEDDFVIKANNMINDCLHDEENNESDDNWETDSECSFESDIDSENLMSEEDFNDEKEEVKSRFTNYSMTSSVIRRTTGLKNLDDHFEKIMEEYDEKNIGCVDNEDVTGNVTVENDMVKQVLEEFLESQKKLDLSKVRVNESDSIHYSSSDNEIDDEELFQQFEKKPKEKWDCESVISTYSNLYNHPKLIKEVSKKPEQICLHKHTGIPVGILQEHPKHNKESENDAEIHTVHLKNVRDKNETSEERKIRKQTVKEYRKNRREEKKKTKLAFKNEFKIQEKVNINTNSQKGIKL